MSDYIDVRNNQVFDSVAGIEIENSRHVLVEDVAATTPRIWFRLRPAYQIVLRCHRPSIS